MTAWAVLSDIHGNLPALEAVIADARARHCTLFFNLGDALSGPLWPAETAALLMSEDWPTIAGNHERQLLTQPPAAMGRSDAFTHARLSAPQLSWLASLPETLAWSPDLFLCHGTPASDVEHFLQTVDQTGLHRATIAEVTARAGARREAMLLCGHSHVPQITMLADGRCVANPGSVGLQAYAEHGPSAYQVATGDPLARYAVVRDGVVELVAVPYDHHAAAAKAAREGQDAWAEALLTGRIMLS